MSWPSPSVAGAHGTHLAHFFTHHQFRGIRCSSGERAGRIHHFRKRAFRLRSLNRTKSELFGGFKRPLFWMENILSELKFRSKGTPNMVKIGFRPTTPSVPSERYGISDGFIQQKLIIHKNPMVFFPTQTASVSIPKPGCGAGSGLGSETTEGELICSRTTLASICWSCHGERRSTLQNGASHHIC